MRREHFDGPTAARRCLTVLFLARMLAAGAFGQPDAVESPYVVRAWRMEDGLPENRIRSILQTRDGYLWVATFSGLARFDGAAFRVFTPSQTPELMDGAIRVLYEDARGCLWLGHQAGGLTRYADGRFTPVTAPDGWPNIEVDSLVEDRDGTLWVMNQRGWLARFRGGNAQAVFEPPQLRSATQYLVNHLHSDITGQLWAHRDSQLAPVRPDGTHVEDPLDGLRADGPMVACPSRAGGMWVVDSAVRRWHQGRWVEDRGPLPWDDPGLTALMETRAGDVCVGTYTKGLVILGAAGTRNEVNTRTGLSHDSVSCLWEDREANLWVGTGGGGLNLVRKKRVQMFSPPDRWQNHPVLCVATNGRGGIWVGTEGAGLYAYDRGKWRNFDDRHGIARRDAWSVHEDSQGTVWVAAARQGLLKMENEQFVPAPGWAEPSWFIYALWPGGSEDLWAGAESGFARMHSGSCQMFDLDPDVTEERVRCFAEEKRGRLWLGTMAIGLWSLAEGRLTRHGRQQGVTSDYITCLHFDSDHTLWVGTKAGGVLRHTGGKFVAVDSNNGLPGNTVMNILEDEAGYFWMGTSRGLARISKKELNLCADGRLRFVDCLLLDLTDGLESLEFSGPNQPNACRTGDGRLWFATGGGLAVVNPAEIHLNRLPPPVFIEALKVDNQPIPLAPTGSAAAAAPAESVGNPSHGRILIQPGSQRIEFQFTGLSLASPQRVLFRHQLEGLEERWNEVSSARATYYVRVPPGDYTFRVKACNNDGVWNETGAALSFTVLPYYWQTWWFRAGGALVAAALVAGIVSALIRRRHRIALAVLERQEAVVHERVRIARDIHDDLGTSLTRVALLGQSLRGAVQRDSPAAEELEQITTTAQNMTRALEEIVWAVDPAHDSLDGIANYLGQFAQGFLSTAGVQCRLDLPEQLPSQPVSAEVRHNLFLAFKEVLNNAVRHASAGKVSVHLLVSATEFTLTVEDDGRGFEPAQPIAAQSSSGGHGLENIRSRLAQIGGHVEVASRPGRGTKVQLHAPLAPDRRRGR